MSTPEHGNVHDLTHYRASGLPELLAEHAYCQDGGHLAIYGDPAYLLGRHMLQPYHVHPFMLAHEHQFNQTMAHQHVVAE